MIDLLYSFNLIRIKIKLYVHHRFIGLTNPTVDVSFNVISFTLFGLFFSDFFLLRLFVSWLVLSDWNAWRFIRFGLSFCLFNLSFCFYLTFVAALFPLVLEIADQNNKEKELNEGVSDLWDSLIVVQFALSDSPQKLGKDTYNQVISQGKRICTGND